MDERQAEYEAEFEQYVRSQLPLFQPVSEDDRHTFRAHYQVIDSHTHYDLMFDTWKRNRRRIC